jgi:hypothetical protein
MTGVLRPASTTVAAALPADALSCCKFINMKRFIPFSKSAVNHYLDISNKNTAFCRVSVRRLELARGPRKVPEKP